MYFVVFTIKLNIYFCLSLSGGEIIGNLYFSTIQLVIKINFDQFILPELFETHPF
jgi:hypothetical protein